MWSSPLDNSSPYWIMFPAVPLCKHPRCSSGPYAYLDEANNKVILFLASDPAVSSSRKIPFHDPWKCELMLWGFFWEQAAGLQILILICCNMIIFVLFIVLSQILYLETDTAYCTMREACWNEYPHGTPAWAPSKSTHFGVQKDS